MRERIQADGAAAIIGVWIHAPGPNCPPQPIVSAAVGLLFYPVDKLLSICVAAKAPFDADLDIRWGPFGALAGIILPWVTLLPYVYPPRPLYHVTLERRAFDALIARMKSGDGANAYREIVGDYPWEGGESALVSVELIEEDHGAGRLPQS